MITFSCWIIDVPAAYHDGRFQLRLRPVNVIHDSAPQLPPKFLRPERVRVQVGWPREDLHFTPWLAQNLDWLEIEEFGLLTLVQTEMRLPGTDRSLDILAETSDGRRVAIENQYFKADHDHFTRGLAYAVGLQARALVVIAEAQGEEFRAVADYLNRCAEAIGLDNAVAVFLVQLTLERVGEYLVPRFEVLTRPNQWRSATSSRQEPLRDVEEFRAKLEPAAGSLVEDVLRHFADVPGGTPVPVGQSVALYVPNPASRGGRTCIFGINLRGSIWFNRGYALASPVFSAEARVSQLDAQVAALLGEVKYGPKAFYGTIMRPNAEGIAYFAQWIATQFDAADISSVETTQA